MSSHIEISVYDENTVLLKDLTVKQRYKNGNQAEVFSERIYFPNLSKSLRFGSTLASKTTPSLFIESDAQHTTTDYEIVLIGHTDEENLLVSSNYLNSSKTRIGQASFALLPGYAEHFLQKNNAIHFLIKFKNGMKFDGLTFSKVVALTRISSKTADYYNKGNGLDFKIMIQEKVIKASKYVLGMYSSVFEAMFENDWKDTRENVIYVNDVEHDIMELFVKALHHVPVYLNDIETALKLFIVADKYCVQELKLQAQNYVKNGINKANVINVLTVAHQLNILEVKQEALKFVTSRKYGRMDELIGFNEMPYDLALLLLNETRNKLVST